MLFCAGFVVYSDNTPYEKIGNADPVSIADLVPFEIPDSWEWVRLGSVINLQSGQDMTPDNYNADGRGIPYLTGASNIENGDVIINRWTESGKAFAFKEDLLLTCKGTVGTMAILKEEKVHIARQIMAIRPVRGIYVHFVQLVLYTLVESLKAAAKSMIPGIAREDVLSAFLPVPPLAEQRRIVRKVDEINPLIEQYTTTSTMLKSLNAKFPEALKKSILQMAIQGKLVSRDPSDEPAEVLLERIREEKARLVKEGKIKRDKHESVIFRRDNSHYEKRDGEEVCIDDEIPFEIPETWTWVRFSTIALFENGDRSEKYPVESDYVDDGIPFFGAKDMGDKYMQYDSVRFISKEKFDLLGNGKLQDGDFICLLRGNVGKTRIFKASVNYSTGFICAQMLIIRCIERNFLEYLYCVMNSPYYCNQIDSKVTGTAVRQLPAKEVASILMPIPPLSEQRLITDILNKEFEIISAL